MERNIFIPVISCISVDDSPAGNLYSPYIGKLETKLSNSRFIFFFTTSLLSSNDGSLETTVSSVFAKISNSTGKEVDFRSTVNVVCAILLLIDMPGTRYRYFWSSNTNT